VEIGSEGAAPRVEQIAALKAAMKAGTTAATKATIKDNDKKRPSKSKMRGTPLKALRAWCHANLAAEALLRRRRDSNAHLRSIGHLDVHTRLQIGHLHRITPLDMEHGAVGALQFHHAGSAIERYDFRGKVLR
jgi:hypothetical protein